MTDSMAEKLEAAHTDNQDAVFSLFTLSGHVVSGRIIAIGNTVPFAAGKRSRKFRLAASRRSRSESSEGNGDGKVPPNRSQHPYERSKEMKVTLNIDCTPDEARAFFGLPDVKPMQEELLKEVQEHMSATLKAMEPEIMWKNWLPATLKGYEQLQEMFLSQLAATKRPKK